MASSVYSYVDYDDFETDRGGPTPTFVFTVDGNSLAVEVEGDGSYDAPEPPSTKDEAIGLLEKRREDLLRELSDVNSMLEAANGTTEYTAVGDDEDDDEEDEDEDDD